MGLNLKNASLLYLRFSRPDGPGSLSSERATGFQPWGPGWCDEWLRLLELGHGQGSEKWKMWQRRVCIKLEDSACLLWVVMAHGVCLLQLFDGLVLGYLVPHPGFRPKRRAQLQGGVGVSCLCEVLRRGHQMGPEWVRNSKNVRLSSGVGSCWTWPSGTRSSRAGAGARIGGPTGGVPRELMFWNGRSLLGA